MTAQGTLTASPHRGADGAASPTRVMIVDDSLIVRTILSKLISAERDMAVVGNIVTEHIHTVPGVVRTVTCVAVGA